MHTALGQAGISQGKFAGCDAQQSGQRFLDSSDPRLIRHIASSEAAGEDWSSLEWDTYPPAGKDKKLSQEFEGSALISAAGTVPSSLDCIENNRHTGQRSPVVSLRPEPYSLEKLNQSLAVSGGFGEVSEWYRRPLGRGKFCGRYSVKGDDPNNARTLYRRVNCGSWSCSYCGPRKARRARQAIKMHAEGLNLRYFLTLTLDPKKLDHKKFAVFHLRQCFNKFREYLRRKYDEAPKYICVLEFTAAGIPHLHILLDRYVPQAWISRTWAGLGGGRIVFIKQVTVQKVARYLSKYLTKELLLSAPKGARRITAARPIKLFPKFQSPIAWDLVKSTIFHLLLERNSRKELQREIFGTFISVEFDDERYLKAFSIHTDHTEREGLEVI